MEKKITERFKYSNFSQYEKYTVPILGFKILIGTKNGTTALPHTHNIYICQKNNYKGYRIPEIWPGPSRRHRLKSNLCLAILGFTSPSISHSSIKQGR